MTRTSGIYESWHAIEMSASHAAAFCNVRLRGQHNPRNRGMAAAQPTRADHGRRSTTGIHRNSVYPLGAFCNGRCGWVPGPTLQGTARIPKAATERRRVFCGHPFSNRKACPGRRDTGRSVQAVRPFRHCSQRHLRVRAACHSQEARTGRQQCGLPCLPATIELGKPRELQQRGTSQREDARHQRRCRQDDARIKWLTFRLLRETP